MSTQRPTAKAEMQTPAATPATVLRRKCACGNQSSGSGTCDECRKKEEDATLRRFSTSQSAHDNAAAPPIVNDVLRSSGAQLDGATRSYFEPRFQRDFSHVRLHADSQAAASARSVGAAAYSVGNRIVLDGSHRDAQGTRRNALLAHELAHVEQHGAATLPATQVTVGAANAPEEHAADARAHSVMHGSASSTPATHSSGSAMALRRAPPDTVDSAMCEANKNPNPARIGSCSYKEPEHCPTYEGWISTFSLLKTFESKDTPGARESDLQVIGGSDQIADPGFKAASKPPKAAPQGKPYKVGEEFIDHPTDEWVKTCLPANLRATAYLLPADCADIAMILRHVWLAAHKRTEMFGKWTLGDAAGKAAEKSVHQMIGAEGTGSVAGMVAPYSAPDGTRLRSFAALEPLLHPGDILVWWHYEDTDTTFQGPRTGGHTHTIASVSREPSGKLKEMQLLQGNQPLSEGQKKDIDAFLGNKKDKPSHKELGKAPGRRIERQTTDESDLDLDTSTDIQVKAGKVTIPVWLWKPSTLLVAAGPPRTTQRPAMKQQKGQPAQRALTDWVAPIRQASANNFASVFEGMLYELRATIEGGGSVPQADIDAIGAAAGNKVRTLDARSGKANAGQSVATHLEYTHRVIWGFINSRDFATSRKLDSAYDVTTSGLWRSLFSLRDAIDKAAGAKP